MAGEKEADNVAWGLNPQPPYNPPITPPLQLPPPINTHSAVQMVGYFAYQIFVISFTLCLIYIQSVIIWQLRIN